MSCYLIFCRILVISTVMSGFVVSHRNMLCSIMLYVLFRVASCYSRCFVCYVKRCSVLLCCVCAGCDPLGFHVVSCDMLKSFMF